jgi:hypothetical protein
VPLLRLLDWVGIVEHSNGSEPDPTSGHCTDDAGRALGMAALLHTDIAAEVIAECCLAQLRDSIVGHGHFCLRLDEYGIPTSDAPSDDATARALWGLSLAATRPMSADIRDTSMAVLEQFDTFGSPYPRAAAHAVLAMLGQCWAMRCGAPMRWAARPAPPWPAAMRRWMRCCRGVAGRSMHSVRCCSRLGCTPSGGC